MKNFLKQTRNLVLLLFIMNANSSAYAEGSNAKIISNLNNIIFHLTSRIKQVENFFYLDHGCKNLENNNDDRKEDNEKCIATNKQNETRYLEEIDENNPYIKNITYNKNNYIIKLQFKSSDSIKLDSSFQNSGITNQVLGSAVDKALSNKFIALVPIYNKKDKNITSWECMTNIGNDVNEFLGERLLNSQDNGKPSIISSLSTSPYISNCIYFDGTEKL